MHLFREPRVVVSTALLAFSSGMLTTATCALISATRTHHAHAASCAGAELSCPCLFMCVCVHFFLIIFFLASCVSFFPRLSPCVSLHRTDRCSPTTTGNIASPQQQSTNEQSLLDLKVEEKKLALKALEGEAANHFDGVGAVMNTAVSFSSDDDDGDSDLDFEEGNDFIDGGGIVVLLLLMLSSSRL